MISSQFVVSFDSFQKCFAFFCSSGLADDQIIIVHFAIFRGYLDANSHRLIPIYKVNRVAVVAVAGCGILQAAIFGNFFLILTCCVIHEEYFQRSVAFCHIRPYIHKCPCGTSGEEGVIMLFGCNFRADCTAIRVGLVDFQTAQRSILGYGANRHGISTGIIALRHDYCCGSSTV